jgi:hypothetical protein
LQELGIQIFQLGKGISLQYVHDRHLDFVGLVSVKITDGGLALAERVQPRSLEIHDIDQHQTGQDVESTCEIRSLPFYSYHSHIVEPWISTLPNDILDLILGLLCHPVIDDVGCGGIQEIDVLNGSIERFLKGRAVGRLNGIASLHKHFVADGQLNFLN